MLTSEQEDRLRNAESILDDELQELKQLREENRHLKWKLYQLTGDTKYL